MLICSDHAGGLQSLLNHLSLCLGIITACQLHPRISTVWLLPRMLWLDLQTQQHSWKLIKLTAWWGLLFFLVSPWDFNLWDLSLWHCQEAKTGCCFCGCSAGSGSNGSLAGNFLAAGCSAPVSRLHAWICNLACCSAPPCFSEELLAPHPKQG